MKKFIRPVFDHKCIEFRYTDEEVCIYGTRKGLKKLSDLCLQLVHCEQTLKTEHIHLEDYEVLTSNSLRGTIALFDED